jgi:Transcription factor WhiB
MDSPDDGWMSEAVCRNDSVDVLMLVAAEVDALFFAERVTPEEVRRVCEGCDVKVQCLAYALAGWPASPSKGILGPGVKPGNPKDVYGVWGGTTQTEREQLLRFIRRKKCPLCLGDNLRQSPGYQVCCGCGQSWPTVRPGAGAQTRLNAEVAA